MAQSLIPVSPSRLKALLLVLSSPATKDIDKFTALELISEIYTCWSKLEAYEKQLLAKSNILPDSQKEIP